MKTDTKDGKCITTGILVLLIIYVHVPAILELENIHFYESDVSWMYYPRFYLFNPFYVTCFIVLEGVFDDFKHSLSHQIRKDFLVLIIPCLTWGTVAEIVRFNTVDIFVVKSYLSSFFIYGPPDFYILYMLFLTRLLYKVSLLIKAQKIRLPVIVLISLTGCFLNNISCVKYWEQALILLPFIEFGRCFKEIIDNKRFLITSIIFYCLICAVFFSAQIQLPMIHERMMFGLKDWIIYMIMGVAGSVGLIFVCKYIQCDWIHYLGKHFVSYILVHISVLVIITRLFYNDILNSLESMWLAIIIVLQLYAATLLLSTGITFLLNKLLVNCYSTNYIQGRS